MKNGLSRYDKQLVTLGIFLDNPDSTSLQLKLYKSDAKRLERNFNNRLKFTKMDTFDDSSKIKHLYTIEKI